MILNSHKCVDNWVLYLAVYMFPHYFSTEKYRMVHAMFVEPENLIQQSFHREIYEGKHKQRRMQAVYTGSGTVD